MNNYDILLSVQKLLEHSAELSPILSKYLVEQKCYTDDAAAEIKSSLLEDLAILLLNDEYTLAIATLFSPVLLDLLTRASDVTKDDTIAKHEWLCICLSKLIWYFPDVDRFSKLYFEKSYGFFIRFEDDGEPPSKKPKSNMMTPPLYKLVQAADLFLIYDEHSFKELCDWSILFTFMEDSDPRTRWFSFQCFARISKIRSSDLDAILRSKFTDQEYESCLKEEFKMNLCWNFHQYAPFKYDLTSKKPCLKFHKDDFSEDVVNVEGVLLSRYAEEVEDPDKIVLVPSVQMALSRLAHAVSAGESVLLQGPVGCGKTSLVEHLAAVTGRKPFEELLKVQLGDHMDGKMLLGTHCCTEVPGEFVWKSGILVQAMTEGHWLLLEDIDCAPMDVISLLVPVLQSKTLVLPGHANPIKASAGFQLFATQRLVRGLEGSFVEFKNNIQIIEKNFTKILMVPFNAEELKKIICSKWPSLEKLCDKILEVYALFSHDVSNTGEPSSGRLEIYSHHDRLVSTRDLFKFCARVAGIFNSKKDCSIQVFQNAVECFCDCIPSRENRILAAKNVGIKFNLPQAKVVSQFYEDIAKHKPQIRSYSDHVVIGRVTLPRNEVLLKIEKIFKEVFAHTSQAAVLLEKVAVAVARKEPVLLVGETGTGKTSVVQHLAELTKHKLTVINMSQQSDSVDLIGGYKPVDIVLAVRPVKEMFFELFPRVVNQDKNKKFLQNILNCIFNKKYEIAVELMLHAQERIANRLISMEDKTSDSLEEISEWKTLGDKLVALRHQLIQAKSTLIFKFIEGALVKAMKKGEWILLDEINLAEAETLECLAGILEKDDNTLFLLEKGDKEPVQRHPDFRIFACMNPATDVGKKDLPIGIRNRFTEFFVEEITEKLDLNILVQEYLKTLSLNQSDYGGIVNFYLQIRKIASEKLSDGAGQYPHYSLRTLCRALRYASTNPCKSAKRSIYEALCLSFLSQLDTASHPFVMSTIAKCILGESEAKQKAVLKQEIAKPIGDYVQIKGYWIKKGPLEPVTPESYIFTETVLRNLHDLTRIVSAGTFPVLLQGETSVGKTSLIQWLAKATGNICVRVNNHEHTDIQEYLGTYVSDKQGKLVFKEGILAEAMRNGYWIILDELNLAPTEVMEALNRVLDDNRELFIPETQTTIKAHPGFLAFATQNPPGSYGGRKVLSRAFRNRFIELHFNEIPPVELEEILHKRCKLPLSYSKKLVAVMHELQLRRRESGVFAGKQGFITLRDLFRWGERYQKMKDPGELDWMQHLAYEGYLLLAGRVRIKEEVNVIQEVIEKHLRKKIDPNLLFTLSKDTPIATRDILQKVLHSPLPERFSNVVWTYGMRRLAVLVGKAIQYEEPVLLIGSTGSGKTTICQIFAELFKKHLFSVNCHMHSESADFIGGLRPVRSAELRESKLFEWVDGPLVIAMQEGSFFLSDEISLADDSVLERLNSVLEPEQKILLAEKNQEYNDHSEITAAPGFQFCATMNPGGDYGKKELSPALRNRFTEIWCPSSMEFAADVVAIVEHNISRGLRFKKYASKHQSGFGLAIAEFVEHFSQSPMGKRTTLSIRDILTWVEFINLSQNFKSHPPMTAPEAYVHGAFLSFLDGIGSGSMALSNEESHLRARKDCLMFLMQQVKDTNTSYIELVAPELFEEFSNIKFDLYSPKNTVFGIGPFKIPCGPNIQKDWSAQYVLEAKTPKANSLRVLRAMQLSKPILLEGSPGVGKTSLVSILAKATGHKLVRINLSEQTDVSDLFGADLPVDGGEKGEFAWRDGPFIQALKDGDWILLDEMNLASQSVLEGLNACLDHRNEIYIPELGKAFQLDKKISRIFCCQNPQMQGGNRKGLPQSFLNRFTQVYMQPMGKSDMEFIASSVYSNMPPQLINAMIQFNNELNNYVNIKRKWGVSGSPWEFNLRDVFRWCDVTIANQSDTIGYNIGEYVKLIYLDRMRTPEDKEMTLRLFEKVVKRSELPEDHLDVRRSLSLNVFERCVQLGNAFLPSKPSRCSYTKMTCIPPAYLPYLESLMKCLEMKWMAILVGPSGCGKSTLVHSLAELCGQELHVLSVNSEMDTTELLGGFEQADLNRKIEYVAHDLQPVLEKGILLCLQSSNSLLKELVCHLMNVRHLIYSGSSLQDKNTSKKLNCLKYLVKDLENLKHDPFKNILKSCRLRIEKLMASLNSRSSFSGGHFEWVDSVLIQAAQRGHWLLIDDANFCSASVLDRLNALLEPGGVLTINEQGIVGGKLRTIVPHPDFRIILTMDPKNGEISRAMRNRGIEIFMEPVTNLLSTNDDEFNPSIFAQCKGLVSDKALFRLCSLHHALTENLVAEPPCLSDFVSAAALCVQMAQKHGSGIKAFHDSCLVVYAESHLNSNFRNIAMEAIISEVNQMNELTDQGNFPITNILPSSVDFRQNPVYAAIKKHACIYTLLFEEFFSRYRDHHFPLFSETGENPSIIPALHQTPVPGMHNDIKRFVLATCLMIQTCPEKHMEVLHCWINFWIENLTRATNDPNGHVPTFRDILVALQKHAADVRRKLFKSYLPKCSLEICRVSGFNLVSSSEIPIDLRWNKFVHQKILMLLREKHDDPDSIEYNYISCANKFSLCLLHECLVFLNSLLDNNPKSLKSKAIEVIKNQEAYQDSPFIALVSVPKFIQTLKKSLNAYFLDESMPCTDEHYQKLYVIIHSFSTFYRIFIKPIEKPSEVSEQDLRLLSLHFSWLIKKIRDFYEDVTSEPPEALFIDAKFAEDLLSCNDPVKRFRHRCLKVLGIPTVFSSDKAAELFKNVMKFHHPLDLAERIKAGDIKIAAVKNICSNLKSWNSTLCHCAFLGIYEKEREISKDDLSSAQDVRIQMIDTGVIVVDDDEIVEIANKPAIFSKMSDAETILELQLLTLWDCLLVTYEAELISDACLSEPGGDLKWDQNLMRMVSKWAIGILGLNPSHVAHMTALQECQSKSLAASVFYFLLHTRHGFSSDALAALSIETKGLKLVKEANARKEWNCNYSWAKQQPLLTHVTSSIYGKRGDFSLMGSIPLGIYSEKIYQLERMQVLLWRHYDQLAKKTKTFRSNMASIIIQWFHNLLLAILSMGDLPISGINKEQLLQLFDKLKITPLVKTPGNDNILLLAIDSILELQDLIQRDVPENELQWYIGKAYVLAGLLTAVLLLPRDHIDPGVKSKVKLVHLEEFMTDLQNEHLKHEWISQIICGQSMSVESAPDHPHVKSLSDLLVKYEEKRKICKKKVPFRVNDEKHSFSRLKSDCEHFIKTLGSPVEILEVLSKLELIQDGKAGEDTHSYTAIQKAQNFAQNLQNFVDRIRNYILFPDMIYPFLVGVEEIIFGLTMCSHSYLMKESAVSSSSHKLEHIHQFLKPFTVFQPSSWKSSFHMASALLNGSNLATFKLILSFCKDSVPDRGKLMYKLVKSAILDIMNEIKLGVQRPKSKLKEVWNLMLSAFQYLYTVWAVQDEQAKLKKAEQEQFYKYKRHESELSDEELLEKELKEMFPTFEEAFGMSPAEVNGDPATAATDSGPGEDGTIHFTPELIFEVCQLHSTALSLFSGDPPETDNKKPRVDSVCHNYYIQAGAEPDYVTPFLLRHEVVSSIVTSLGGRMDSFFDNYLLEGQLLRCQDLLRLKGCRDERDYNIYRDPNPAQVVTVGPVLRALVNHVQVLLKEFPENPNLINITVVADRVLNFPISDPLMKFVIGLELVLETTQVWEQNAHSKVSLKEEIALITQMIIQFRSKELDLWKKGLQSVIRKQYVNSSKWWFFMFPLFYSENTYLEEEKFVIIRGLQQCLEDSPIGEFPARLNILDSFLREFQLNSSSASSKHYCDVLFNIYTYYKQFLPSVEAEIQQIKKPIEKDLKDFVKIARWNDVSFYAVKASVEKSHKTILKHFKAFEDALRKPAKSAFALPSKKTKEGDASLWSLEIKKQDFIYKKTKVTEQFKSKYFKQREETFFQKLPKFEKKMSKKSKQIADTYPVVGYINSLNDFCGNIIEALESVTTEGRKSVCTRSREKKQTLLKIQNKKQMLATLFKNLRAIGLSYRQGIVEQQEVTVLMSTPSFNLSKMEVLIVDKELDQLLKKSSEDTNHYFYKSIAQYAQLLKAIELPSKDLTLDILHRIHGYGCHLMNLVVMQRKHAAKWIHDIDDLGKFLSSISKVHCEEIASKNASVLPPQKPIRESDVELSNLLSTMLLTSSHFDALLNAAPQSGLLKEEHQELNKTGLSGLVQSDSLWSGLKGVVQAFNCDIKTLFLELSQLKLSQNLVTWGDTESLSGVWKSVLGSYQKLSCELCGKELSESVILENIVAFSDKVSYLHKAFKDKEAEIMDSKKIFESEAVCDRANVFKRLCQRLATEVLLAVQDLVLFSASDVEEEASEDVVPNGLFTAKITNSLLETKNHLHLEKVLKITERLRKYVNKYGKTKENLMAFDQSFRLLINLAPLLNQYYQLVKVFLAATLGMHRVSCKFLSILLEIFNLLATQGFCIPPELQEEAAKSGATKFEDIESGGLGEGEGTKDVSANIESEDQLEDAFKEGEQEKKEKEEPDDKELKDEENGIEMSNDFEGKTHSADKADEEDEDGEEEDDEESQELDKQMGDIGEDDAEKLDERVWGSDSENEDDLKDEDGSGGVTDNRPSELAAKDNKFKEDEEKEGKDKGQQPQDVPLDEENDEYAGEHPDPMIDAPPELEIEGEELPENMKISDDVENDGPETENADEAMEQEEKQDDSKEESLENETTEDGTTETEIDQSQMDSESKDEDDLQGKAEMDANEEAEAQEKPESNEADENYLPSKTPSTAVQALPSELPQKSMDQTTAEEDMDWEGGAQASEEQHREGLADSSSAPTRDPGHEGKKSTAATREMLEKPYEPKLKQAGEKRTLDETADESSAKRRPIQDRKNPDRSYESNQDNAENAEMYEHVSQEEESSTSAVDIATQEQAEKRAVENKAHYDDKEDDEEEIIEILSSDDDEVPPKKPVGDSAYAKPNQKPGERGKLIENEDPLSIPEGETVLTHFPGRSSESTIHTQTEMWKSLNTRTLLPSRPRTLPELEMASKDLSSCNSDELWRVYEWQVSGLSQELCEQLRLVLEPTKMSKFKGDYRTGKRLNMRKIIPYIASQFRKDKIWLRRTKPTKRQYQIMLAVDDSASMADNNSKQLAFESLAVLGQSLTLLEAGELSVVSFGERVKLLHPFQETFSSHSGAKILEQFTFSQKKTKIAQLLNKATELMAQARSSSRIIALSKETAQLLIIISDGRGILSEGEDVVRAAVKNARDQNIFMVFLILDSVSNKDSILDITCPIFEGKQVKCFIPYMDKFPFPFYIILREISALPLVLGEALRQWFELVTSVDR